MPAGTELTRPATGVTILLRGLRGYTAGFKYRAFLEASVSQIFTEVRGSSPVAVSMDPASPRATSSRRGAASPS